MENIKIGKYDVRQATNGHITISLQERRVAHFQAEPRKLTEDVASEYVQLYEAVKATWSGEL